jgi:hypothetical protein
MKLVLDVYVWISGLLWGGIPGQILKLAKNQRITLFASANVLTDIKDTLNRPKLQHQKQHLRYTTEYLMAVVKQLTQLCADKPIEMPQLRDPDDAVILAIALVVNAEVIVTGDLNLLVLKSFKDISIIMPKEFLSRYPV